MSLPVKLASAGDSIRLWDSSNFTLLQQFNPHPKHSVSCISWSSDYEVIASASDAGDKIVLNYLSDGATSILAEEEKVSCVTFNSSSRYIAGGLTTGDIKLWDLKRSRVMKTYEGHNSPINCMSFNWNDTNLASGSNKGYIIIHNVVTSVGCNPLRSSFSMQAIRDLQFSLLCHSVLGTVSDDGGLYLWDTNTKQSLHTFKSHQAPALSLSFSPVNEMLLVSVGLDKMLLCYDIRAKNQMQSLQASSPLTAVSMHIDGSTIATGDTRGKFHIFDLRFGKQPVRTQTGHKSSVHCLTYQYRQSSNNIAVQAAVQEDMKKANVEPAFYNTVESNHEDSEHQPLSNNNSGIISNDRESKEVFSPLKDVSMSNSSRVSSLSRSFAASDSRNSFPYGAGGVFSPLCASHSFNDTSVSHRSSINRTSLSHRSSVNHASLSNSDFSNGVGDKASIPQTVAEEEVNSSLLVQNHNLTNHNPSSPGSSSADSASNFNSNHIPANDSDSHTNITEEKHCEPSTHNRSLPSVPNSGGKKSILKQKTRREESAVHQSDSTASDKSNNTVNNTGFSPDPLLKQYIREVIKECLLESGISQNSSHDPKLRELIRSEMDDLLYETRTALHKDIVAVHFELIKQFVKHTSNMEDLVKYYSVNNELLEEIGRLRLENEELRRHY